MLEKEITTHANALAWEIPRTEKPGRLRSMGSQRVGRDEQLSCSVTSNSLPSHGLYSPWNSPGQNTRVGCLFLLQVIFPTQGSSHGLLHCWQIFFLPTELTEKPIDIYISFYEARIPSWGFYFPDLISTFLTSISKYYHLSG